MNILITQGKSSLAAALAGHLSAGNMVRLTDMDGGDADAGTFQCDLGHDSSTDDVVRDIEAIIHIGSNAVGSGDPAELLDYHTRGTYNPADGRVRSRRGPMYLPEYLASAGGLRGEPHRHRKMAFVASLGGPAIAGLPPRRDRVQGVRPRQPDRRRDVAPRIPASYAVTGRLPPTQASPRRSRLTTYSPPWRGRSPRTWHAGRTFTFNHRSRGNGS